MNPEAEIHSMAHEIRRKVSGSYLFGIKLDPNNPDHLIVAAYCLSLERDRALEIWRKLAEFEV